MKQSNRDKEISKKIKEDRQDMHSYLKLMRFLEKSSIRNKS